MKKFNIRKVLDGLSAASSSSSQPGNRENDIHETLQSEHFQLCKYLSDGQSITYLSDGQSITLSFSTDGTRCSFLQVPWTPVAESRRSVFRMQVMASRPEKFPAFPDFMEEPVVCYILLWSCERSALPAPSVPLGSQGAKSADWRARHPAAIAASEEVDEQELAFLSEDVE
ncbi:UNVERIFIED_CONTAM: hypothetical protein FKN15_007926 [Acipenser sinensis]